MNKSTEVTVDRIVGRCADCNTVIDIYEGRNILTVEPLPLSAMVGSLRYIHRTTSTCNATAMDVRFITLKEPVNREPILGTNVNTHPVFPSVVELIRETI